MTLCKNCGEEIPRNYCTVCGQKGSTDRLTIKRLLRDLPHAVFHVDRGFLYNFTRLFKMPGQAIQEYLAGRRKPFFHPATYLVLSLILNYVVVKVTDLHFYDDGELTLMDPLKAKAITDYDAMQWWFLEHTYIYILIAIPASALFLFLIFKLLKQNYNLAETTVVILFTIAQGVLIQTMIYAVFGWVDSGPFLRTIEMINMAILVLYASHVIFQLTHSARSPFIRLISSLIAGAGLAVVWITSAYLLYLIIE